MLIGLSALVAYFCVFFLAAYVGWPYWVCVLFGIVVAGAMAYAWWRAGRCTR